MLRRAQDVTLIYSLTQDFRMTETRFGPNDDAVLFDGQGIFGPGMGKKVRNRFGAAKIVYQEVSDFVGIDMAKVCFGSLTHLQRYPEIVQPAIITTDLAEYAAYREIKEQEAAVVGALSLGIFAAYGASGIFESYPHAVLAAAERARMISEYGKAGKMALIFGLAEDRLEPILKKTGATFAVMRDRARKHFIITGGHEEVEQSKVDSIEDGARRTEDIEVDGPYHSELLKPVVEPYEEVLDNFKFNEPRIAVVSNTGFYITSPVVAKKHLIRQITEHADFDAVLETMANDGINGAYEMGPDEKERLLRQMVENHGVIPFSMKRTFKERVPLQTG
ncbi:MAG: Malonyl CoA-acyl carrier protein transacylase [Candidatus Saccharibacteria bacterium GW2011_GWA2_46_10]|nr:MAG: Malonyl CoA-acyl carrier protein transacylase [Candidatus Saccharibacteria bacterium GW2011_GWA2_46_10]